MKAQWMAGKPPESTYLNCIRCGLCLAVCPTYREQLHEAASPRGRVALARKELEGALPASRNLRAQMDACLDCMACDQACPVGIRPSELVLDMRGWHERLQRSSWKQILFGRLLTSPRRLQRATLPLRLYQMLGIRRMISLPAVRPHMPERLRDLQAMLPPFPRHPLRQALPEVMDPAGQIRLKVGFFLGCVQSLLFADQSAATARVLSLNGCKVITPRGVLCCGMPSIAYGRPDLARQQARHNIRLFESLAVDVVVTDCATCGSALKGYARLLADDPAWTERAEMFSSKVRDVSEFLIALPLDKPRGRVEARVTYHDPCHLRRGQGVWRQPRELLNLIAGLEFVELPEADWCCGSAGSQLITHYTTSVQVLDRKMANLKSTGAQVVASGCPACRMQLNTGLQRTGLSMQVVHPMELLDRAYRQ